MQDTDNLDPISTGDESMTNPTDENSIDDIFDEVPSLDESQTSPVEDERSSQLLEEPLADEGEPSGFPPSDEGTLEGEVEESKGRRFFRKFIRWTVGLLIVFGLGLLTGIFLLYQPATRENSQNVAQWTVEMDAANAQIADLQDQISDLNEQVLALEPLKDANNELLAAQDGYQLHIAILDARVDVTSALLAMAGGEDAVARITLEKTAGTLDKISKLLEADQREVITSMKGRLDLVMGEIDEDPYAAQSDLDVLSTNLLQLEDSLFKE